MRKGKQMTEGELKQLTNGSPLYAVIDHPDPSQCFKGVVYVQHEKKVDGADRFCYLNVGGSSNGYLDYTFGEKGRNDFSLCEWGSKEENDGETLKLFRVLK